MKYLLFILSLFMLTSCGHFHDEPNVSVWAEGLWLAFWLPFLGGLAFIAAAYVASKSNSTQQVPGGTLHNTGNVSILKLWKFRLGVILVIISFGIVWYVNSDYWK